MSPPLLAAELPPVDACPSCDPGIPGPALPAGDPEQVVEGTAYPYQCEVCGTGWTAVFDAHGWPVDRSTAPVRSAA